MKSKIQEDKQNTITILSRKFNLLAFIIIIGLNLTSCFDDRDDNLVLNSGVSDINDFVWKGMNEFYVFGNDVPDLSNDRFGINGEDNRFDTTPEYLEYLEGFDTPEDIFDALVFDADNTDRFSDIFPNLFEALDAFGGTSFTNGIRFSVFPVPNTSNEVFAVVRLVANGSTGDIAGIRRNMIITGVDGITLNRTNFNSLLTQDTTTFNFADYDDNESDAFDDDIITPNDTNITVSTSEFTENPVHRVEVFTEANQTIGYIMYNSFRNNFETELNQAFGELKNANVQHLVLDLRYNGGGAIVTATRLASMITGQFDNELYANNINGPNRQDENATFNFNDTIEGGAAVNSLNLDKVYVLTTSSSASASELTINSLRPYIEVIQIGTNTAGKTTSNRLVFDSPTFGTQEVTSAHTYALFPLIGNVSNSQDVLVPSTGLVPNFELSESPANFGTLGDSEEPLLARAIADITGTGRLFNSTTNTNIQELKFTKSANPLDGYMYDN